MLLIKVMVTTNLLDKDLDDDDNHNDDNYSNLLDKDLVDDDYDDNHNGEDTNLLDKVPGDLSPAEVSCSARENFPPMALLAF